MDKGKESREIASKLNFYWPVLIVAVLAISIKEADFSGSSINAILEISAWVLLVISLMISISRIEKISILLGISDKIGKSNSDEDTTDAERYLDKLNTRLENLYLFQKYGFFFAVVLILTSKAYLNI